MCNRRSLHTNVGANSFDDGPLVQAPGVHVAERAILLYRRRIPNLKLTSTCRFEPTCSTYGLEAVHRFGAIRGLWLTLLRIFRCAPWHPGGRDPVPATFPGLGLWFKRMHR